MKVEVLIQVVFLMGLTHLLAAMIDLSIDLVVFIKAV